MVGGTRRREGSDPDRIVTRSLPEVENSPNHSRKSPRKIGSGPRGRRFKSSRPDQFLRTKKTAKSSLPGHSVPLTVRRAGTECSALQIPPSSRIVRDFSPASLATRPSRDLYEAKRYPSTLPDAGVRC